MMVLVLAYIGAYLVGSIPVGVLFARAKGIDIMSAGSGNIGATNVARVLGKKAGIAVFLLDVLKGVIPPVAFTYLAVPDIGGLTLADHKVLLGVMAIVGHMLSPWLRFRGGKGIATGLGALLGTAPLVGLCAFGVFLVVMAITRIVSISSIFGVIGVLSFGWFVFPQGTVFKVVYVIVAIYVISRHRSNIQRLLKGEEPKFELKKPGSTAPPAENA